MGALGAMMLWEGKWVYHVPSRRKPANLELPFDPEWWALLYPRKPEAYHRTLHRELERGLRAEWRCYLHDALLEDCRPTDISQRLRFSRYQM